MKPYLHPARAEEIAYSTQNPYSDFPCHETVNYSDCDGDGMVTEKSLTCAGFFAMQTNESREPPEGYDWPGDVYSDPWEMTDAYADEWERTYKK